jgi:hypothetical protein
MGPYAGVDYNSPYIIVNSLVSYPPHYKGKGVKWGRSFLEVEYICICLLISKSTNRKREEYGEVVGNGGGLTLCLYYRHFREGVRADLMSLNRHFMEHGQSHA